MKQIITIGLICALIIGGQLFLRSDVSADHDKKFRPLTEELSPIWYKTWTGKDTSISNSIARDSTNIYLVGQTYNHGDGKSDSFLLKYDQNGNLIWNRTCYNGVWETTITSVAVDSSFLYLAGSETKIPDGVRAVLIRKYDKNGDMIWNRTWHVSSSNHDDGSVWSIAIDNTNIYATGWYINYDTQRWDAFILRYDQNGNMIWNRTWSFGSNWRSQANSITIDNINLFIVGEAMSIITGNHTAFFLKYDENGNMMWNRTWYGDAWDTSATSIAVDSTSIYITGGEKLTGGGGAAFVLSLDKGGGNIIWNKTWKVCTNSGSNSIAVDNKSIYIADTIYCDASGKKEAFILKYDLDGNMVWNKTIGLGNGYTATAMVLDNTSIYVTGFTRSINIEDQIAYILKTNKDGGSGIKPSLSVDITANPIIIDSGQKSTITVHVSYGAIPILPPNSALITLNSDKGGTFSLGSGNTNETSNFTDTFTAPVVETQTICQITAKVVFYQGAIQEYRNGSGHINVTITSPNSSQIIPQIISSSPYIGTTITMIIIFYLAFITESGSFTLAILFLSILYPKDKRNRRIQKMILKYLTEHESAHYREIKKELKLPIGSLVYHLRQLELDHLIASKSVKMKKIFCILEKSRH